MLCMCMEVYVCVGISDVCAYMCIYVVYISMFIIIIIHG